MEQWLNVVLLALAVWRVTSIVHQETIADGFRRRFFGVKHDGVKYVYPDTFRGHLIACFRCVSVWAGLLMTLLWLYDVRLIIPFAVSAAAIILEDEVL